MSKERFIMSKVKFGIMRVAYLEKEDCYDIYDDYGGTTISISELKKLLKLVKKTHQELLK